MALPLARSGLRSGNDKRDEYRVFGNHSIVVRRPHESEAWLAYKSFTEADKEMEGRFLILSTINGIAAARFTRAELYEQLLVMGDNRATLKVVSARQYNIDIKKLVLEIKAVAQTSLDLYWDLDHPCNGCGKIFLTGEKLKTFCCHKGSHLCRKVGSPVGFLKPLSSTVHQSSLGYSDEAIEFRRNSALYNNRLALAVVAVNHAEGDGSGKFQRFNHSEFSVTMHGGKTYHCLKKSDRSNGLTFLLTNGRDDDEEIKSLCPLLLQSLLREQQRSNVLLTEIVNVWKKDTHVAKFKHTTNNFDVYAVRTDDSFKRKLVVNIRSDKEARSIELESKLYEPLAYPLLFCHGEYGWSSQDPFSLLDYVRIRLFQPEDIDGCVMHQYREVLGADSTFRIGLFPMNRFRLLSNLAQYYAVDMFSRMMDIRLKVLRLNQKKFFNIGGAGGDNDFDTDDHDVFLPDEFLDGRRMLRRKARNVLELVSRLGRCHVFITLTCNPLWREIQEMMDDCDNAYTVPEVTCRVFKVKLLKFLDNLNKGAYFDGKSVKWISNVIEYQRRGLPHAHIVVCFNDMPEWGDNTAVSDWIDAEEGITALMPVLTDESTDDDVRYFHAASQHMIHNCRGGESGCIKPNGLCKNFYDSNPITESTYFDYQTGFPVYKRLDEADLKVVPHNRKILMHWNGHANVEYCASSRIILYLFKYLFKGNKKEGILYQNREEVRDEHAEYLSARTVSAMSSYWNFLGYSNYPPPTPRVVCVKIRSDSFLQNTLANGRVNIQLIYFARPAVLAEMIFPDFCMKWSYSSQPPNERRDSHIVVVNYRQYYISAKERSTSLLRVKMQIWNIGEEFYQRMLMIKIPCRSVEELYCYQGVRHDTLAKAAFARGICTDYNVVEAILDEAIIESTPKQMRSLYATLTLQGFPTVLGLDNDAYIERMTGDYMDAYNCPAIAKNKFLIDLEVRLREEGRSLAHYGFPLPNSMDTELERETLRLDCARSSADLERLERSFPSSTEQSKFLDDVKEAIRSQQPDSPPKLFLLQGSGGTGKTTAIKKVLAFARSLKKLDVNCASTAIAASVYDGSGSKFLTAHCLFKLPVVEDDSVEDELPYSSKLYDFPELLELLLACNVICWDEVFANSRMHLDEAFRVSNGMRGKVLILIGDIKQMLSICEENTMSCVGKNCIIASEHFTNFRKYEFSHNVRLQMNGLSMDEQRRQKEFCAAIEAVGIGMTSSSISGHHFPSFAPNTKAVEIGNINFTVDVEGGTGRQAIFDFLYPKGYDSKIAIKSMVMCTTNKLVDAWNRDIQKLNPSDPHILISDNQFEEVDDHEKFLQGVLEEAILEKFDRPNQAPHKLTLKVNDICFITRNMSRSDGLVNNSRVRILKITSRLITVQTCGEKRIFHVPRIRFSYNIAMGASFKVRRTQFPLRLAYSCTYNKSQAQTLQKAVLDVRMPLFAHGHLYVGLTRVTHYNNMMIFCRPDQVIHEHACGRRVLVDNIVYEKLIYDVISDL